MKHGIKIQNSKRKKAYSGIKITSGIDKHLNQWNVSIYIGKRFHKTFQQPASSEILYNYLSEHFPGGDYYSAYESGYFGFVSHRELESLGIRNKVLNASDIPTSDKEKRRKNDRIDSKKIAKSILYDKLEGIYIPSQEMESDRRLVRYRTRTVRKAMSRAKQRLKSFLVMTGKHKQIQGYQKAYWSKGMLNQIKQLEFAQISDQQMLDHYIKDLESAKRNYCQVNRQLVMLSRRDKYSDLVKRLRSIPGIGLLTAMALITEIGQMERFESLDKLSAFVGIIPDTSGSGEKERIKGITGRANVELRRLVVQSAWVATRSSVQMAQVYHRHLKSKGIAQKAIIRVSRKLLSVIRAIWIKGELYKPAYYQAA